MPLFLSHVAVKIRGLCLVYIVYSAKQITLDRVFSKSRFPTLCMVSQIASQLHSYKMIFS